MVAYKHVQKLQDIWVHHELIEQGCKFLDARYERVYPIAMKRMDLTRGELKTFIQDQLRVR